MNKICDLNYEFLYSSDTLVTISPITENNEGIFIKYISIYTHVSLSRIFKVFILLTSGRSVNYISEG